MTLLESLVALVILGLSAVGYLEVFQASARSVRAGEDWARATAVAESVMEGELLARRDSRAPPIDLPNGFTAQVDVTGAGARLSAIAVTVTTPDGKRLSVHRLTRTP